MDIATNYIAYIEKQASATWVGMLLLAAMILVGSCDLPPVDNFEKHFPKNEKLLEFKAKLIDPPERQGYEVYELKSKYDGDTLNVKFKLHNGIADVKGAIGFDGDTLKLFYRLWCEPCATEWAGFELNYKILNKPRKKYKVLPVFVRSEDLEKM